MAELDADLDNLRAALAYVIARDDGDRALRLVNAIAWHLLRRGGSAELRGLLRRTLACSWHDAAVRARALLWLTYYDPEEAAAELDEAHRLATQAGDPLLTGMALEIAAFRDGTALAAALSSMDAARAAFKKVGADDELARLAINRAFLLLDHGQVRDAGEAATEALRRVTVQGNRHGIAVARLVRAAASIDAGDPEPATQDIRQALDLLALLGDLEAHHGFAYLLGAAVAAARGDRVDAAALLESWERLADPGGVVPSPADERRAAAVRAAVEADGRGGPGRHAMERGSELEPGERLTLLGRVVGLEYVAV
jgi:tetratricopeptide (TPR) repeat protein